MACEPTAESAVDLKTSLVKYAVRQLYTHFCSHSDRRKNRALASGAHSDLKIIIDSPVDPNGVVEISVRQHFTEQSF